MPALTEHQLVLALVALAAILVFARAGGEIARRLGQPEVLGELIAGFLLGPSVFGTLLPSLHRTILLDGGVALVLSGFSWIGAILVLLLAGMELDLSILRGQLRPGLLAAAFAVVPSLVAGTLFAAYALHHPPADGVFLGIVLTVTGVSVVSKILIERGSMRREYAQVILAAGVASEIVVWLFVSVVSSLHGSNPWLAGLRSTTFAIGFFLFVMTLGRWFVFRAMRWVRDTAGIVNGQVSLVLVLTLIAAAITQELGLHALLGAFVVGVLLSGAPRANVALAERLQSLTLGFFGPIFFALAGMRVDLPRLGSPSAVITILLLLVVATVVKVGFSALGARLGGRGIWDGLLVGVGLNLKGGTDVVVAVIGTELGLLSVGAYTMYAVVGILTVLASPVLIAWLEGRTPPSEQESERLETEEASRRAYVPNVERVLVPVESRLLPVLAANIVERIAASKQEQGQLLDITQLNLGDDSARRRALVTAQAGDRLHEAATLPKVELTQQQVDHKDILGRILEATEGYDLVALGAHPPKSTKVLSLGRLQDAIIHRAATDVLVVVDDENERLSCDVVERILVPTNGLEYSLAAGDIAGALASSCGASVVLMTVVHSDVEDDAMRERDCARLQENADAILGELCFRLGRFGVETERCVVMGEHAGARITEEMERHPYSMVVMGAMNRGHGEHPYLGRAVRTVLSRSGTPVVLLVSRG